MKEFALNGEGGSYKAETNSSKIMLPDLTLALAFPALIKRLF